MNIAIVTDQLLPQSATDTKQTVSMASALAAAGNDVTLVAPRKWMAQGASLESLSEYYGVPANFAFEVRRSAFPNIRGIEKVAHAVTASRSRTAMAADVALTRNLPFVLAGIANGQSVLYDTYRPWPLQRPASRGLFYRLGRSPKFVGLAAHSKLAAASYAAAGLPEEKLLVAYNGFEPDHFSDRMSQHDARALCNLPRDKPLIVYTGRISDAKGAGALLNLAARFTNVQFVLVGAENDRGIEEQARRVPNVRLLAWRPIRETVPFLFAADVLIIPPTSGPLRDVGNTVLPIKTFHYMAAGRAILAPSTPDVEEILEHGVNAYLVAPDEPDDAAAGLASLLDDAGLREKLSLTAAEGARKYTWLARAQLVTKFLARRLDVSSVGSDGHN